MEGIRGDYGKATLRAQPVPVEGFTNRVPDSTREWRATPASEPNRKIQQAQSVTERSRFVDSAADNGRTRRQIHVHAAEPPKSTTNPCLPHDGPFGTFCGHEDDGRLIAPPRSGQFAPISWPTEPKAESITSLSTVSAESTRSRVAAIVASASSIAASQSEAAVATVVVAVVVGGMVVVVVVVAGCVVVVPSVTTGVASSLPPQAVITTAATAAAHQNC